jgi:NAD(P)-dependent dehydrogenase (short-subunit alcohol dehydrogenase family)
MDRFKTKTVVITGAGSGFGRALALNLARKGWRIGIADINDVGSKETLKMVEQTGGSGEVFHVDVADPQAVKKMADHFYSKWKRVDLLINNAGIAVGGAIGDVTLENWKLVTDIDYLGVVYGCHEFVSRMKAQGGGHILNIASAAGILSLAYMGTYNAAKAAVIALSETLRVEVAPDNIGVTVCCPTFFNTGLLDDMDTTSPWIGDVASTAFSNGISAETVAKRTIKAVEKNKLYAIPMIFMKILWLNKRLTPGFYYALPTFLHKRGLMQPLYLKLAQWGILSH